MPGDGAGAPRIGPGSVVAGLAVRERIGQGGMAIVFRAEDLKLRRRVALKVLNDQLASDPEFRRRFIRESRAAAAVEDPHIIPIYDAGEADGVLYISMRFLAGGDLRSLVAREGPPPAVTVGDWITQIASALDAAHQAGLVHRDVKPANMLAGEARDDAPAHVYLADFGLSKPSLVSYQLTASNQLIGTLDYIAPEQVTKARVDGRVDQYALACSAFELLTGAPPFAGRRGVALIQAHVAQQPPRLRSLRPDLGTAADAVLARALSKDPLARYATCRRFATALAQALASAPADPTGLFHQRPPIRRAESGPGTGGPGTGGPGTGGPGTGGPDAATGDYSPTWYGPAGRLHDDESGNDVPLT